MNEDTLADLIRSTAPVDFAGVPIYVALTSKIPVELRPTSDVWGYHSGGLDVAIEPWLSSIGKYEGRGVAICVNDLQITADVQNEVGADDQQFAAELIEQRIVAVAFHETAHGIECGIPKDYAAPSPTITQVYFESLAAHCANPSKRMPAPFAEHHGAPFVRVLLHLCHRAERDCGVRVVRPLAFVGSEYSLSPIYAYEAALHSELESYAGTLAELRTLPPPREFRDLWQCDLKQFVDELHGISEIVSAVVAGYRLYQNGATK